MILIRPINELAVMLMKIALKIDTMKNKILGALILISNIFFFIPQSVDVIKTDGGAMGFGWMVFPFLIFINLFTIPAILSFLKKFNDSNVIFWINLFGVIFIAFCVGYILRSNGRY